MLLTKLKLATAVLVSVVVIGAGVMARDNPGSKPAQPPREGSAKPFKIEDDQAKAKLEALRHRVLVEEAKLMQTTVALEQAKANREQAKAQLQAAQADYDAARLRAAKARLEPATPPEEPKPARALLELRGSLRAAWVVHVTPTVAGKITEVHVHEGDLVKAGQLLATLDERSYLAKSDQAKANYEVALARLVEAMAGESDEKKQPATVKARIGVANAELKRAEGELKLAEKQIEYTQLRSPVAGLVANRRAEVGDTVNPGNGDAAATRLFELIDPRLHTVAVSVPERDIRAIFVGQKVRVEADALPGAPLAGEVVRFAATADPATATIAIQIKLRTPDGDTLWKPGMSVIVAFLPKE